MFLRRGENFEDVSLISGVDFTEDGRGFVMFDYDNDGSMDLGIVSNQNPRFRIAKNNLNAKRTQFVKLRLFGGNQTSARNDESSPRDPIGATIIAKIGQQQRMFRLSGGEGFSVQNSRSIHIGLGEHSQIEHLEIRWPSGKITVENEIVAGSTFEIFENRD